MKTILSIKHCCLIILLGFLSPQLVSAQIEQIRIPELRMPRIEVGRGGAIRVDGQPFGQGSSVQVSVENGVKTITATENGETVRIVDDPDNGIQVKWTRRYGPEDAAELEQKMPGLYMHLKSIPKTVDNSKVDIHVDVTTDYEADDEEDLKNRFPDVFRVYEKYASGQVGVTRGLVIGGGGFRGGVRAAPGLIKPAPLRINDPEKVKLEEIERKLKALVKPEVGGAGDRGTVERDESKKEAEKDDMKKDGQDKTAKKSSDPVIDK